MTAPHTPRVVIVGAGFGGLYAAQSLARAPVQVTIIDKNNYHLFQPMLYQVATGELSADQIAAPIRAVLRDQRNAEVLLGEVTGVDTAQRLVKMGDRDRPLRLPDPGDRVALQLFRPRRVAAILPQPQVRRRRHPHPGQAAGSVRGRRAAGGAGGRRRGRKSANC